MSKADSSPEILAPAGGRQQLIAAVRCGADAVYLGAGSFNARASAENFSDQELTEAVSYCHACGVKTYVAMNTLIKESEADDALGLISEIAESGADAVIIQDLGVAALWRRHCPKMPLHASTQLTVHDLSGVKAALALGFTRVVAARELTLVEIESLCGLGAQIEVFVHGALCMSVSGTCYMSSMLGGRSGNRGRCAQPCRLDFKASGRSMALSLKDMSLTGHIDALARAGVNSLKIEGRLKRPEYVAAAVTAVRAARDGEKFDESLLRGVFSRSGFTDGYLTGRRTTDMFGYRKKEDVTAAQGVLKQLAVLYKDERQSVPVDMSLNASLGGATLTVTDSVHTAQAHSSQAERAITKPLDLDFSRKCLTKTGATPFYLENLKLCAEENISVSAKTLNALRREALDRLLSLRAQTKPKKFLKPQIAAPLGKLPCPDNGEKTLAVRFSCAEQMFSGDFRFVIAPVDEILKNPRLISDYGRSLTAELEQLSFGISERELREKLARLKSLGVKRAYAGNIGSVYLAAQSGFSVLGGFALNILNSEAIAQYRLLGMGACVLSPEISAQAARQLGEYDCGVIGYGRLPLMNFRVCPAKTPSGCSGCTGKTVIKDRFSADFPLICHEKRYSTLLNSVPLYLGDKRVGASFELLYFTTEKKSEAKKIADDYMLGKAFDGKRTTGLFYRELL